ncbi:MAG: hypothetical protein OEY49_18565, partial [Candidatus Heimdallarchaeota archaeon]|nr:hypothetical protein [Candidatus Heimdallarchaeota archaeon]
NLLIIYSTNNEKDTILSIMQNEGSYINIFSHSINELNDLNLNDYDIIMLISSLSINFDDEFEAKLIDFLSEGNHGFIVFSPNIDTLEDNIEDILQLEIEDSISQQPDIQWSLRVETDIGNVVAGRTSQYIGDFSSIDVDDPNRKMINIYQGNSISEEMDEFDFPYTVMVNSTTQDLIAYVGSISLDGNLEEDALHLLQIPQLIGEVIKEIIRLSASNPNLQLGIQEDNQIKFTIPLVDITLNLFQILSLFIFLMVLLFYQYVLKLMKWLIEKFYLFGFAIIGAFYNIQDRIIDSNQVLMNKSRFEILDYLTHVGGYGAHLREIKSITKMGTGSLLWHLQVLEDFNLIIKIPINGHTVFINSDYEDKFDSELKLIELKIQSKYTTDIFTTILSLKSTEGISVSDIEDETGINTRAIRRILKKMDQFNLITISKERALFVVILDESKIQKILESLSLRKDYRYDTGIHIERNIIEDEV